MKTVHKTDEGHLAAAKRLWIANVACGAGCLCVGMIAIVWVYVEGPVGSFSAEGSLVVSSILFSLTAFLTQVSVTGAIFLGSRHRPKLLHKAMMLWSGAAMAATLCVGARWVF